MATISGGFLPPALVGSSFNGLIHVSDFYPTLCVLAGVSPEDTPPPGSSTTDWVPPVDGHNIWSFLNGGPDPRHGSEPLVISSPFTSGPGGGAMIVGRHKIVYNAFNDGWDQPPTNPISGKSKTLEGNSTCLNASSSFSLDASNNNKCQICSIEQPCLYDLINDPSEVHDLSGDLTALLHSLNTTYSQLVFERRLPVRFLVFLCPLGLCPSGC